MAYWDLAAEFKLIVILPAFTPLTLANEIFSVPAITSYNPELALMSSKPAKFRSVTLL